MKLKIAFFISVNKTLNRIGKTLDFKLIKILLFLIDHIVYISSVHL